MNLSTLALLFVAWQMLKPQNKSPKQQGSPPLGDIANFLNEDTKGLLDSVQTLSNKDASQEEKTGAILQVIANPTVMGLASSLFGGKGEVQQPQKMQNDEGYSFEAPSTTCKEFFAPIDHIADAEIKNKLYWFYDNWYTAK